MATAAHAAAPDVGGWVVLKGQNFDQAVGQTPQPDPTGGWVAFAGLWPTSGTSNGISNVWLERGAGSTPMNMGFNGSVWSTDGGKWHSKAEFDGNTPNSLAYTIHWTSSAYGSKSSTLGPVGTDSYPAAPPNIRNLASLQSLPAGQPFTVEWDAMVGGTTNDFIMVELRDVQDDYALIVRSPFGGLPGSLDGTRTSYTFPAGLPKRSTEYEIGLSFVKVVARDTQALPGAFGGSCFMKNTEVLFTSSVWNWDAAYGPLFDAGSGRYGHPTFGWLWFSGSVASNHWAWSSKLQGWLGRGGTSTSLWSPQFRWLTWSGTDGQALTSALGTIWIGSYQGNPIPDGWVVSDRFSHVWAKGDGVWFWSDGLESWLGVTPEGRIWCVGQNKFL
jgi:hypothetical protein